MASPATGAMRPRFDLTDALAGTGGPLLFGVRLWVSVCLALFVAFWLQLDNPSWAGATAAIMCQPQLGASLRKGWFRVIGTVIGAVMIVVLTAFFPQDRIAFLGLLALWGGVCAFAATVLKNFASYAAALAGYTAAIIAADTLGATGGASPSVFLLAVDRASAICIGIVCAGVVLAGTDLGGARRQLAQTFAGLAAGIADRFVRMLALAPTQLPDTQAERREFVRRVIALDPVIDEALGESSELRYHSPILQGAIHGLFRALDGWRAVAIHLGRLPQDECRPAELICRSLPPELRAAREPGAPARWMADPLALRGACAQAARTLIALPARTPSLRLLADETAKALDGLVHVLDALALLVDAPGRPPAGRRFQLTLPDWLPALVNAARAFVAIAAVELFWVVTAWPSGALAIVFAAIVVLLLSPRGDMAYAGAVAFALGSVAGVVGSAVITFAVLPALQTFPAFCVALGLYLVPVGFVLAWSRRPAALAVFTAMAYLLMPLVAPTNPMTYDTAQFYNSALAIVVACILAPVAFRLLPPLSPALRTRRLLDLTLRDLRRLAVGPRPPAPEDWDGRIYGRLAAMPAEADPLQRAQLLTALAIGNGMIEVRDMAPRLGEGAALDAALAAFAQGNCALAIARLRQLDRRIASAPEAGAETLALRARGLVLVVSEALSRHLAYLDRGAPA